MIWYNLLDCDSSQFILIWVSFVVGGCPFFMPRKIASTLLRLATNIQNTKFTEKGLCSVIGHIVLTFLYHSTSSVGVFLRILFTVLLESPVCLTISAIFMPLSANAITIPLFSFCLDGLPPFRPLAFAAASPSFVL